MKSPVQIRLFRSFIMGQARNKIWIRVHESFFYKKVFTKNYSNCISIIMWKKYLTCLPPLLDEDHLALDVQSLVHFLKNLYNLSVPQKNICQAGHTSFKLISSVNLPSDDDCLQKHLEHVHLLILNIFLYLVDLPSLSISSVVASSNIMLFLSEKKNLIAKAVGPSFLGRLFPSLDDFTTWSQSPRT